MSEPTWALPMNRTELIAKCEALLDIARYLSSDLTEVRIERQREHELRVKLAGENEAIERYRALIVKLECDVAEAERKLKVLAPTGKLDGRDIEEWADAARTLLRDVIHHSNRADLNAAHANRLNQLLQEAHIAEESIRERAAEFKNFHRLLCERFGYGHDPLDWWRDQLSLIEHIAKLDTSSNQAVTAPWDAGLTAPTPKGSLLNSLGTHNRRYP